MNSPFGPVSSIGRAPDLQSESRGSEPCSGHNNFCLQWFFLLFCETAHTFSFVNFSAKRIKLWKIQNIKIKFWSELVSLLIWKWLELVFFANIFKVLYDFYNILHWIKRKAVRLHVGLGNCEFSPYFCEFLVFFLWLWKDQKGHQSMRKKITEHIEAS